MPSHARGESRSVGLPRRMSLAAHPAPAADLWHVHSVFMCILSTVYLPVAQRLLGVSAARLQPRHPVDGVNGQAEAVHVVLDGQFHRGVDAAFFLIAAHMQVAVIMAAIGEAVNQPGVTVKVEDHRLVHGEQAVEIAVAEAVGMFLAGAMRNRSTTLIKRTRRSSNCSSSRAVAASASCVAMSPQPAITRSGSLPWSVLAQSQMP